MLNCNSCKNPVSVTLIYCEWCGAKIIHETENIQNNEGGKANDRLSDFINKINEVEIEIVKENASTGTWGALDGILTRAFGNSKIDSLNQKKATIIQTYPLPKNPDDLLEIANMATSNYKVIKVHKVAFSDKARNENKFNHLIKNAWKAKAEQALNLLTIYSRTNDYIREQMELLKNQLIEEKKGWF